MRLLVTGGYFDDSGECFVDRLDPEHGTRERLLSKVWQEQSFVTGRSVDTLVKRLRKKIETDPADPQLIVTVWGDGYKFADV